MLMHSETTVWEWLPETIQYLVGQEMNFFDSVIGEWKIMQGFSAQRWSDQIYLLKNKK